MAQVWKTYSWEFGNIIALLGGDAPGVSFVAEHITEQDAARDALLKGKQP